MENSTLTDGRLYELILTTKSHMEDRRDEINKFYTSMFSAIIAIMPFLSQLQNKMDLLITNWLSIRLALIMLVGIGVIISLSWVLTLIRISNYLEGFDKLLIQIEKRNHKEFISYLHDYLESINSPERITKQTMLIPYSFIAIFSALLVSLLTH
jgi:hypothetical protein